MPTAQTQVHKPHRVLRYINIAIGILLLLSAAAVYWFVYRVLPQTSGTIAAPVSRPVTIARDALGVPHISAANEDDAFFAQGYVTAQDRLFQMDGLRRLAGRRPLGDRGPGGPGTDRDSRRLRMRRIAEHGVRHPCRAQDRAPLAAYARGVNCFIQTHLHALPIEFTLLGYDPRPWSVVDTILIGLHMYRDLTTSWKDEILKRDMLAAGDRAKVDFLFPPRSGGELQPGSNAWAVSGAHTASGKPHAVRRHAPGILDSGHLVHDPPAGAGPGCVRRFAAGHAVGDRGTQPADRLGRDEPALRCAGSLYRELRSGNGPLPLSRELGAGARRNGRSSR